MAVAGAKLKLSTTISCAAADRHFGLERHVGDRDRVIDVVNDMRERPRTLRRRSSATFIGPGDGAVPGAGCGKAVDIAVWNVTCPSTFCIT